MPRRESHSHNDRRALTHAAGQHGQSALYNQLLRADQQEARRRGVGTPLQKTALWLMPAALVPWLANLIASSFIDDQPAASSLAPWWLLSLAILGASTWQLLTKSKAAAGLRRILLIAFTVSIALYSVADAYAELRSHAGAVAGPKLRALELFERCGRRCWRGVYQAADGRIIGRDEARALPPSTTSCAIVQELRGSGGRRWIRVLERSRMPQRGQLTWPILTADCFSERPLSLLPR
jgi:hypothetical protein